MAIFLYLFLVHIIVCYCYYYFIHIFYTYTIYYCFYSIFSSAVVAYVVGAIRLSTAEPALIGQTLLRPIVPHSRAKVAGNVTL